MVTGSRAEYGLLYPLIKELQDDSDIHLQLVATGMHLSPEFGYTVKEILQDGFHIDEKVEMLLSSDSAIGITKSMGLGLIGFADVWARLEPELVIVLGDRYEIMVAVQAAMMANIPVAHLHGGESTEGAVDEAIRHAITKMSHLHFVATEPYKARVLQLGESPNRVFNVGAIGLDNICRLPLLSREEFQESIDFRLGSLNLLVTYHPVTLHRWGPERLMGELLAALDQYKQATIIFTKPNSDAGGRAISAMVDNYVQQNSSRRIAFQSLGTLRYLSAIQHVDAVIGNSSSGIIEVPLFHKPTVNVGDRQKGRVTGSTVISCGDSNEEIAAAIRMSLSKSFYEQNIKQSVSVYGAGGTASKIKQIVKEVDLSKLIYKSFHNL